MRVLRKNYIATPAQPLLAVACEKADEQSNTNVIACLHVHAEIVRAPIADLA